MLFCNNNGKIWWVFKVPNVLIWLFYVLNVPFLFIIVECLLKKRCVFTMTLHRESQVKDPHFLLMTSHRVIMFYNSFLLMLQFYWRTIKYQFKSLIWQNLDWIHDRDLNMAHRDFWNSSDENCHFSFEWSQHCFVISITWSILTSSHIMLLKITTGDVMQKGQ
jgi:uncharacterized membrane-anchored protein YitT (DUF2179 family)